LPIDPAWIRTQQETVMDTKLFSILNGIKKGDRITPLERTVLCDDFYLILEGNHRSLAHYLIGAKVEVDKIVTIDTRGMFDYFKDLDAHPLTGLRIIRGAEYGQAKTITTKMFYRQIPDFKRPVDWEKVIIETQVAIGLPPDLTRYKQLSTRSR